MHNTKTNYRLSVVYMLVLQKENEASLICICFNIEILKGAGSRNRTQTFCEGQPACMRNFVYKLLCLTKWRTMKRRVGLPFLSPEFE